MPFRVYSSQALFNYCPVNYFRWSCIVSFNDTYFFFCSQSSPIKCCSAGVFVCMNISSSFCSFALSYVSVMPIMLKFPFQKI